MNCAIRILSVALIVFALTACALPPRTALDPEVKQRIKRVAIAEIPEPKQYFFDPGPNLAAIPFMHFGFIGGAIAGGINGACYEAATSKFTEAITPLKPNLAGTLLVKLEEGLKDKGYDVIRVTAPPKDCDGRGYDVSKIEVQFDAIIVPELNGGYRVESHNAAGPKVTGLISMFSKSGAEVLFSESYLYCQYKCGEYIQIVPDPKYSLTSEALYEHLNIPIEGLRTGVCKIAELALAEL